MYCPIYRTLSRKEVVLRHFTFVHNCRYETKKLKFPREFFCIFFLKEQGENDKMSQELLRYLYF